MGVLGLLTVPKYSTLALSAPTVRCISRYKHPWVLTTTASPSSLSSLAPSNIIIKIFVTLQFEATEMILKSKFWWLLSLIQSYWAVQSSTRAAQKFCSRCLACPHPLVIVANCAKLRYNISPYLWFSRWGSLPSIEWLRRKLPVPRNNRLLLSLSQVFCCQFNLWHHYYFYTATLATSSCFYSASSCLVLQFEARWLQQAIITSLFRSLPSSAWSAAVRTSPIPSFIVI